MISGLFSKDPKPAKVLPNIYEQADPQPWFFIGIMGIILLGFIIAGGARIVKKVNKNGGR